MNGVQVAFAWLGPLRVPPAHSSLGWIATIETQKKSMGARTLRQGHLRHPAGGGAGRWGTVPPAEGTSPPATQQPLGSLAGVWGSFL